MAGGVGWFAGARDALALTNPARKCAAAQALWQAARDGTLAADVDTPAAAIGPPGRPPSPELVEPGAVPRRRLGNPAGRAALVHAIAHIEFNAINLALDAVYRFRDMPDAYYRDWLSVAADEARHYRMLEVRLGAMGHAYGDFPAHDGLWEMAERTAGSCLQRMALVPRVLEARGLDVTPGMMDRLEAAGDQETVRILAIILDEEVRHVKIGSRWFRYECERQGLDPDTTFQELLERHFSGQLRGPFNWPARRRAGFSEFELRRLAGDE
ncbi:MAG TPA: ferritin-like domain-containing protein [Xanthomonadales bacterium]|nr:ferritin-like domain-containing protein [Xanthomonadales bacterium]